ncbi:hypothetical protein [Flavobacterium sp. FlaQc-47]|jgi:hypothetical protein|uniref:hypothetical protein n=1 Tax=Flavobacterium sp. FlaQc-47 TaxID=3374180 RepID=UPI00375794D9
MSDDEKYNFRILHKINYELFDKKQEANVSYEIELKKFENYNFRVALKRDNFKIDGHKPESKFEKIAHAYNDALFPVLFDIIDGNFSLVNFSEIIDRLELKDAALQLKYQGSGFDFIREDFLQKVAKDGYAMVEYLYSFGLIRILLLCAENPENSNCYNFNWKVLPLGTNVFWKGKKSFDTASNILKYEGEGDENDAIFEKVKTAANAYQYPDKVTNEESVITTTIKQETQYNTTELDFKTLDTQIKISNSYFNYLETFSITAFSKTEDKHEY